MTFNFNLFLIGSRDKWCGFRPSHLDPDVFKELKNLRLLGLIGLLSKNLS